MSQSFTSFGDLLKEIEPPDDGILTRTLFDNDRLKVVLFGFASGEELSEHTASWPVILHVLKGELRLKLGDETQPAQAGTWVYLPADMRHAVQSNTASVMLLTMLKQ